MVGYETPEGQVGYNWGEDDWMNAWVDYDGSYKTEYTTAGVTYKYTRLRGYSTIRVDGKWDDNINDIDKPQQSKFKAHCRQLETSGPVCRG